MRERDLSETYISIDIEADGPIPGRNSMLSLGAAAFKADGTLLSTFKRNLLPLPEANQDEDTMRWWKEQPESVWLAATTNPIEAKEAMTEFAAWVLEQPGRHVAVCYPAGFDWTFVRWYLAAFNIAHSLGFSALDIKSFAAAHLQIGFKQTVKRNMPKSWFEGLHPHTHDALDDAIEQGQLFCRILRESLFRALSGDGNG